MWMGGLQCEVWQPSGVGLSQITPFHSIDSFQFKPPRLFNIHFYVSSSSSSSGHEFTISCPFGYKNFRETCTSQDWLSWSTVSSMLSQTNVPYHLQPFFIQHISTAARRIASQPHNALSPTIPIVVHLILPPHHDVDHPRFGFGSGIEEILLERVDDDDDDDVASGVINCVICLDEISINHAVRMPCLHVYHRDCIGKWLQLGNPCPLCRLPKQQP